jgi:predicted PurR-regulated permease PerM
MQNPNMENNEGFYSRAIYTTLRIGFVLLLLAWSLAIIKPFILPVIWGIIIAVAIYPFFRRVLPLVGSRRKTAATLTTIIALAILILPSAVFIESAVNGIKYVSSNMQSGSLSIPAPPESVMDWPVIGESVYDIWLLSSTNTEKVIIDFAPQLKTFAPKVFSAASGIVISLFLFIVSIIIAGVLLAKDQASDEKVLKTIFTNLIGKQGEQFVEISVTTIRNVVQGVIGVAVIQAILGGIGIWVIGIPGAGLWALIIMFTAIMQLPPLIVLGPLVIYAFTITEITPAVIFLVWSFLVSASDALLKPIFLGRGADVPMLTILLGAIGGMMLYGIIGLFVGAVILTLSYKIFKELLMREEIKP